MTLAEFEKYAKEHNIFYCTKELQEQCEDAISREDAIQNIHKWFDSSDIKSAVPHIEKCLNELPPVRPQEPKWKTGRWIATEDYETLEINGYFCSVCDLPMETDEKTDYCPNCGAKMVEPQESEVNNG